MDTSKRRRKVIRVGKMKKDDTHTERRKIMNLVGFNYSLIRVSLLFDVYRLDIIFETFSLDLANSVALFVYLSLFTT